MGLRVYIFILATAAFISAPVHAGQPIKLFDPHRPIPLIEPQESRRFVPREHHRTYDFSPAIDLVDGLDIVGRYAVGVWLCTGVSLILARHEAGRELRNREAWEVLAGCAMPVVGRMVVHALLYDRPDLDDRVYLPPDVNPIPAAFN